MTYRQTPEQKVMKAVTDYLNKKKIFWLNIKTTGTWDAKLNIYRTSPYTLKGTADLLVIKKGDPIFCELKAKAGRMSADQKLFQKLCEAEGIEYYIIRSTDDLKMNGI